MPLTNILTAVGHKPYGKSVGLQPPNPDPFETDVKLISKRRKFDPYQGEVIERLAPGEIKLSKLELTFAGFPEFHETELLRTHLNIDRQSNDAHKPHQWMKDPLPEDNSGEMIEQAFQDMSEQQLEAKTNALKERGFTDSQINEALKKIRNDELDKAIRAPFLKGVPGVISHLVQKKVTPGLTPVTPAPQLSVPRDELSPDQVATLLAGPTVKPAPVAPVKSKLDMKALLTAAARKMRAAAPSPSTARAPSISSFASPVRPSYASMASSPPISGALAAGTTSLGSNVTKPQLIARMRVLEPTFDPTGYTRNQIIDLIRTHK